ncbi:MAG: hypothetical protein ACYC7L_03300 [Nitrospirota bacterium]
MLSDLITALTTPCSPALRHMGYLTEAIEMRGRARRNKAAWQPHLDNTRSFVLSSAEKCGSRNKVIILGSGLLLDVPLAELAAMFREVVLMDVVCLPEIRKRIKAFNNVSFIEGDVTNTAGRLYQNGGKGIHELPESVPTVPIGQDCSLVVSLNILSQLWVIPRAYAGRRFRGLNEYQVDEWCGRVVAAHYSFLRSLPCDVCLVGDYEFVKRDRDGGIISKGSTVYDLELSAPDREWTWNIVPPSRDPVSKELIVGAWHLPRSS